jgi:hypothetical protein
MAILLVTAIGCSIVLFLVWPFQRIYLYGENDFLQFYAGGKLAFTDRLYNPDSITATQIEASGATGPAIGRFVRLPYYAFLLAPLAKLPYLWAYAFWQALNALAVAAAVLLWPFSRVRFGYLTALCLPLYWGFASGQDVSLILLGIAGTVRLMQHRRDAAAGVVFAVLCLIKFHFLWLTPLVLIRRPRMAASFVLTAAALLAPAFLIDPMWPLKYYKTVLTARGAISKVPYTLFRWVGWSGLPVAILAAEAVSRRARPEMALPAAIALAIVVSPHAYIPDYALMLPVLATLRARKFSDPLPLSRQLPILRRETLLADSSCARSTPELIHQSGGRG